MSSANDYNQLKQLRQQIPLGLDMAGNVVTAQKRHGAVALKHTCVTGSRRVDCICNLLMTFSCLYDKEEVSFIILSPRKRYAELLGLKHMNVIVPYVRTKAELDALLLGLRDLVNMYSQGKGYPHLFLVVDGLEELPDCNLSGDFKEYNDLFAGVSRRPNIEIISGVDLIKSIYSGCPGAFVGIGNCLITTREDGKADVTYVGEDTNLSLPVLIDFPSEPPVKEMVQLFNGLSNTSDTATDFMPIAIRDVKIVSSDEVASTAQSAPQETAQNEVSSSTEGSVTPSDDTLKKTDDGNGTGPNEKE